MDGNTSTHLRFYFHLKDKYFEDSKLAISYIQNYKHYHLKIPSKSI